MRKNVQIVLVNFILMKKSTEATALAGTKRSHRNLLELEDSESEDGVE